MSIKLILLGIFMQINPDLLNNFTKVAVSGLRWLKSLNYAVKSKKCSAVSMVFKNTNNFMSIKLTLLKVFIQIIPDLPNSFTKAAVSGLLAKTDEMAVINELKAHIGDMIMKNIIF